MELGIFERIILLNVLPKEGDFSTLKIVRNLRESLSFSEEEHKILQFKTENGRVLWKPEGDMQKDVPIGEKATDIIVECLKRLNKEKHLKEEHIPIYERFIKE